ncbi:MAG: FHA domain-containing protein [Planctomycetes bacterium]|nr:FHA domain-containing protein [Planctomycetota bacterium]
MIRLVNARTGGDYGLDPALDKMGFAVLGRLPCAGIMREGEISRFHATVLRHSGSYFLVDHSMNGTWRRVAGSPESVVIKSGLWVAAAPVPAPCRVDQAASYEFDRKDDNSYQKSLAAFLKMLDQPTERQKLLDVGVRLEDGMMIEFGTHELVFRVEIR